MQRQELESYLNNLLAVDHYKDYCPNGLQVQGKTEIQHLVTGVSACRDLLEAARDVHADAILVHHGYFWKGDLPTITHTHYHRIKLLLDSDMSLFAYHIPLDAHAKWGNNCQLAQLLGWQLEGTLPTPPYQDLLYHGHLTQALPAEQLAQSLQHALQHQPLLIGDPQQTINHLAWCTGAAGDYLSHAIAANVDAYVTGEICERHVHLAQEAGICLLAAGHHASERGGVQALGEHIAQHFSISHQFIDIPNPV